MNLFTVLFIYYRISYILEEGFGNLSRMLQIRLCGSKHLRCCAAKIKLQNNQNVFRLLRQLLGKKGLNEHEIRGTARFCAASILARVLIEQSCKIKRLQ